MLMGRSISSPSKSVILVAPPDMIFLMIKGLDHLGFIFPLGSKVSSLSTVRANSPSLSFLGFNFLLNALTIIFWYPCTWYCALAFFSSIKANYSYHALAQSSSDLNLYQYPQRLYFHLDKKHRLTTINQRVRRRPS